MDWKRTTAFILLAALTGWAVATSVIAKTDQCTEAEFFKYWNWITVGLAPIIAIVIYALLWKE